MDNSEKREELRTRLTRRLVESFNFPYRPDEVKLIDYGSRSSILECKGRTLLEIHLSANRSELRIKVMNVAGTLGNTKDLVYEYSEVYTTKEKREYSREESKILKEIKEDYDKLTREIFEDKSEILDKISKVLSGAGNRRYNVAISHDPTDGEGSKHVSLNYSLDTDILSVNGRVHIRFDDVIVNPVKVVMEDLKLIGIYLTVEQAREFARLMFDLERVFCRD